MAPQSLSDLGKLTYLAYSEAVGGTTHDGRPMPAWDDLGEKVQGGWIAAAAAAADRAASAQAADAEAEQEQQG